MGQARRRRKPYCCTLFNPLAPPACQANPSASSRGARCRGNNETRCWRRLDVTHSCHKCRLSTSERSACCGGWSAAYWAWAFWWLVGTSVCLCARRTMRPLPGPCRDPEKPYVPHLAVQSVQQHLFLLCAPPFRHWPMPALLFIMSIL